MGLHDLPLNTELDAESAGGKLAECVREDPKWNERSDEEDEDAEEKKDQLLDRPGVRSCVRIPT